MGAPVAIVVLNWNGSTLLEKYLPTLVAHTPSTLAEIFVADNGSTDDSISCALQHGVQVIELGENYGFAEGYNRAIATLSHPCVLLLNSDVRVSKDWLPPLIDFMDSHPDVVSVQPKICSDRDPSSLEYAGALGGYMDRWGYPFCRGRIFDTVERDQGQYGSDPMPVFWTSGAAMLCRRSAFVQTGGLASDFFAHQEEIDLCWRWLHQGYSLYVVPASVVYHYGGASLDASNPRKTYLNFRNNLRMLYRNLPPNKLLPTFALRLPLDLLAAVALLLRSKPAEAASVLRGWRDFLTGPKQRLYSSPDARSYDRLYPHLLPWRYYARGETTFSQLKR